MLNRAIKFPCFVIIIAISENTDLHKNYNWVETGSNFELVSEMCHDPLPGRDPAVEKPCTRPWLITKSRINIEKFENSFEQEQNAFRLSTQPADTAIFNSSMFSHSEL